MAVAATSMGKLLQGYHFERTVGTVNL